MRHRYLVQTCGASRGRHAGAFSETTCPVFGAIAVNNTMIELSRGQRGFMAVEDEGSVAPIVEFATLSDDGPTGTYRSADGPVPWWTSETTAGDLLTAKTAAQALAHEPAPLRLSGCLIATRHKPWCRISLPLFARGGRQHSC